MEAVLRVVPVTGETTWSFLHRVADAYHLQATDLAGWWRWVNPVPRRHLGRPDAEVLLDADAQAQLAGWCRIPAPHLARALPSWQAGPDVPAARGRARGGSGEGRGWARWRMGELEWGPVVFAWGGQADGAGSGRVDAAAGRGPCAEPAAGRQPAGPGWGLRQWNTQQFTQGVEHARRHAERYGHLALTHTQSGIVDGFDLGRWLARRRAEAASLTARQTAQLIGLDPWWNPPWPVGWQRCWHRARAHVAEHGPVHGGNNLDGLPRWLEQWLRRQITRYDNLHPGQQELLARLGLTAAEVERFRTWPARPRPLRHALASAHAYAARYGHLAVSGPTVIDGTPLDAWLSAARRRQRTAGRPTRLGARLSALDLWWNPDWPLSWQRMWWAAHHHLNGLPAGTQWWPDAPGAEGALTWLRQQHARRCLLLPGQQQLTAELMRAGGRGPVWQPRISDRAWQTLTQLLPSRPPGDRRYRSERQILEAVIHIACTRQTWPQLPAELGSFPACRTRFQRWHADGTLTRICHTALPESDTHWQQQLTAYTTPDTRNE